MKKAIVATMAVLFMSTISANAMPMGPGGQRGPGGHGGPYRMVAPPPPSVGYMRPSHRSYAPPPPPPGHHHRHHRHHHVSTGAKVAAGVIIGGLIGAALMTP